MVDEERPWGTVGDSINDASYCYMISSEVHDFNFG